MDSKKRYIGICTLFKSSRYVLPPLLMPALPAIAASLMVATSEAKYIIVMISVGLMLSRLVLTFFGDRFFFKEFLLLVTPLSIIGSLLGFIPSIYAILFGVILVSFSYGSAATMTPAILHEGNSKTVTESIGLVSAMAPWLSIAALLGSGYIVEYTHWQYLFYVLIILGCLTVISIIFSNLPKNPISTSQQHVLLHLKDMFTNKKFIIYVSVFSLVASGMLLFIIIMPFLLIKNMHVSAHEYALIALPSYVMNILAGYYCMKMCNKLSQRVYYAISLLCFILSVVVLYIGVFYLYHLYVVAILSMSLYSFALGTVVDYTYSRIVMLFPNAMNSAIAVLGITCNIAEIIVGFIASHISDRSTLSAAIFLSCLFVLVAALLVWLRPSKQLAVESV